MEKSKRRDLLYEELKNDEKRLIQWYRENPVSVYIEIALIKLLIWGIITENEYNKYQLKVVKKATILRSTINVSSVTADETMTELWAKKNSELMSVARGVRYMRDLGVFTEEEINKYLLEIMRKAK